MMIRLFRQAILSQLILCSLSIDPRGGVDHSWPTQQHTAESSTNNDRYVQFMEGCYQLYGKAVCDANERERIALNLAQPALQTNFTSAGYAKVRLSDAAFRLLQDFWDRHHETHLRNEAWSRGSVYVNHWEASTQLLLLDDPVIGWSAADRQFLQHEVESVLSRWSGTPLTPTSLYGIRIYTRNSILAPHIDRLPLVISAIINVAQDVEEEWPLEVIGHDGVAVNVTMQPGDMILYESHSVLHGRPYPLQGNYFANVFVHFEPVFYTMQLERQMRLKNDSQETLREKYEQALAQLDNYRETKGPDIPPHIEEGSLEATRWRQEFAFIKEDQKKSSSHNSKGKSNKRNNVNRLAAQGALDSIQKLVQTNPSVLHQSDDNGWQPVHEAARAGQTQVIEYLVEKGVDLNARTNNGNGGTPLWWAEHMLPNHHETIKLLRNNGAVSIAPGTKSKSEKKS